jgi:hypothetical protein
MSKRVMLPLCLATNTKMTNEEMQVEYMCNVCIMNRKEVIIHA